MLGAAVLGYHLLTVAAFLVSGSSSSGLRSSCVGGSHATHAEHVQQRRKGSAVQSLRAASDDGEEGGFVNPYNTFRKWQMDLVRTVPKGDVCTHISNRRAACLLLLICPTYAQQSPFSVMQTAVQLVSTAVVAAASMLMKHSRQMAG